MRRLLLPALLSFSIGIPALGIPALAQTTTSHALSLIGAPKYPAGFTQLDYVNVNAPKGGEMRAAAIGGFDNLNPFIPKGDAAPGLGLLYETLMASPMDDDTSEYGLIAETVEVPDDLSFVIFNLRAEARWADGQPITAEDVAWSFEQIQKHGEPQLQLYYANVQKAEILSPRKVRFRFSGPKNRELPQIMGQLPIVQKTQWEKRGFDKVTKEIWGGSGPYRIASFEANRFIVYERRVDWWGKDLPLNKGRYNFDRIRYEMFRDTTVMFEAFKSGQYDYRRENIARNWHTGYDIPAVEQGHIIKAELPHQRPAGLSGFLFNLRKEKFQDSRVRRALSLAFDYEWMNKTFFYSGYTRSSSYFQNSDFTAKGEPSADELKLLEPLRAQLPKEVFGPAFIAPVSDGSGQDRRNLREAAQLLKSAGWELKNGKLINARGEPLTIEFLYFDATYERFASTWGQSLQKLGVTLNLRLVDTAQYIRRLREFEYDLIFAGWGQSNSPGNEQRSFFSSQAANNNASQNWPGIKSPAIDTLIDAVIYAPERDSLITATRALDRALTWGYYLVPGWHLPADRIAYWDKFGRPEKNPKNGVDFMAWWVDAAKAAKLAGARPQ